MVGGRLRCLGTCQHLKNKYGRGLMAEIRLETPAPADVASALRRWKRDPSGGPSGGPRVDDDAGGDETGRRLLSVADVRGECVARGKQWGAAQQLPGIEHVVDIAMARDMDGSEMHRQLTANGQVTARLFEQWWLLEQRCERLVKFMAESFGDGNSHVLERHEELLRFKVLPAAKGEEQQLPISGVFKLLETHRGELEVREYSVSQTSLEQIFNQVGGTHSRTHALTHARTHALAHSLTHSRTHARTHSLTHSHTHSPTHSLTAYLYPVCLNTE
jgi:ATP-binding cassette subfamily A (ABC1) protein 1